MKSQDIVMFGHCRVTAEGGNVALVTTDLLSANRKDFVLIGVPRYLNVCLMSIICSVTVFAATNSDAAVSTVACLLEYQSTGVLLTK